MPEERFEIAILQQYWPDSVPGHRDELALPFLEGLDTRNRVHTLGSDAIEIYAWESQTAVLTRSATSELASVLEAQVRAPEEVAVLARMRQALGWGSVIQHGLSMRCFAAGVGGVAGYRGLFLDATSQRPFSVPVARVAMRDDAAHISFLPVHIPFADRDPVDAAGNWRDPTPPPEAAGDVAQLRAASGVFEAMLRGIARAAAAVEFRRQINDPAIRAALAAAGKLRPMDVARSPVD